MDAGVVESWPRCAGLLVQILFECGHRKRRRPGYLGSVAQRARRINGGDEVWRNVQGSSKGHSGQVRGGKTRCRTGGAERSRCC